MDSEVINLQTRRRLAKLFGVKLYQVDVEVDVTHNRMKVCIDGEPLDPEKRAILEKDVRETTQAHRERFMN